ncbi:MAG: hypothetical protein EON98_01780 [Chitinophagaceae bacterium]|nr:MAG: hypothetical protein EON98_01780 [Chitinophagaceae bacterium]
MLTGAIIGGIVGLLVVLLTYSTKNRRFKKLLGSVQNPDYAGLYHYASQARFKKSMKFFDSYGLLYVKGNSLYYKATETDHPLELDLAQSSVQQEPDWRKLKWFSVTTPVGEKHYFNSHKLGAFVNNSDETLRGLAFIKSRTGGSN